jgi:hypothetical protein
MHDTAFQIGTLALNIYTDLQDASILEIGSQSVNGSLRKVAFPTTHYVGVDIEDGEGVDIVVVPGEPLPVEDRSFDLVMATSVFEHDPMFWVTFLEMCRAAKDGGYIYINAPSNGVVHRYPQDNWRFYPDSGRALAKWAVSQGQQVSLVESFVADREADIWNDFVAVFRKGRITKALPKVFLYENVSSTNIINWKSDEIINPSDAPQDMQLLAQASLRAEEGERAIGELTAQKRMLSEANDELNAKVGQFDEVHERLRLRESELTQRQEEIAQTRSELDSVRAGLQASDRRAETESRLREQAEALMTSWKDMHEQQRVRASELTRQLSSAMADAESERATLALLRAETEARIGHLTNSLSTSEKKLKDHFGETAALSRLLMESEQLTARESDKVRRLKEIHQTLAGAPRWWAFLPRSTQQRLLGERLRRAGLFDPRSYLQHNPDVADAGLDPLYHFVAHGLEEDRRS